ncbi:3'-5' RNA helicase YTHDC2-like [Littorina saxatilis]|uniref:RNA helicase n=1 Tax=Littorina saxatilis TaxID=31220 RepID=A0AAN9C1H9_9CAEN
MAASQPMDAGGRIKADSLESDSPSPTHNRKSSRRNSNQSRPGSANQSRPGSANQNRPGSAMSGKRGPRRDQDACIGEEVKIGIHLAVERFKFDENRKELEFPSSFTATERAYVHRLVQSMGFKSKSKGKGANRVLNIYKKEQGTLGWSAGFQLARNSRHQIMALLQRLPLTTRERADLQPRTQKMSISEVTREFNKTTTGRLNNGVPQVPPRRGESDLNQFRQTLPVYHMGQEVLATINGHQVTLIAGETGSGKTTQVPQMILDDCHSRNQQCRILCTQPRRIAALSIAERVAAERAERIGQTVGYQIRLESKVSPKTLLTFCTNGVLLRTLMGGTASLNTVTHVIVDEVHERDRFSDFLLLCLKEALPRFKHLKLVLMSAALNIQLFTAYFNGCPVVKVPGTTFNVEEYFLEDVLKWTNHSNKIMEKLKKDQKNAVRQQEQLTEWCSRQLTLTETSNTTSDVNTDDGVADLETTEFGEEKEELGPELKAKLDELLTAVWLTGQDDAFHQIFHLIMSENVSVDYIHSATSVTPLMVAAGRGFPAVAEQLLALGANPNLRSSNGWTALDWAKRFIQGDVVELLEAHVATLDSSTAENDTTEDLLLVSPENRELLSLYQQSFDDDKVDISLVTELILKIHTTQPEGAMLIFLPGYDDIVATSNAISTLGQLDRCKVFVLHSAMQSADQKKVFSNYPRFRKVILATNIAETSITINDVVYVIDCGKVKEKTFCALTQVSSLKSNWISKASALQRKGRAGRCRTGVCYHLFSRARYACMQDYQQPEILRLQLHELCLHTKLLSAPTMTIAEFLGRCPQAPPFLILRNAVAYLKQMDALDEWEELTELGHHLTDLPVEPRLGKMVLHAVVLKCLDPILTIVCALAYKDPFILPAQPSQRRAANMARRKFAAGTFSDHMALLRAFQMWQKARTEGWEKSFCEKNFLSAACMEMVVGMRAQLLGQLRASGFVRARGGGDIRDLNTNSENWAVVKAALCAGMFPNLLFVDRKKCDLVTQRESKVRFHQGSVLSVAPTSASLNCQSLIMSILQLPCDWLVYEEMTRMERLAMVKCCTLVSPITVVIFAGRSKLPSDALKVADNTQEGDEGGELGEQSDSEGEEKSEAKKTQLQLDDWLTFSVDSDAAHLALQLRQKWHALFLRRMRAPSKPWSQSDEEVVRAVINILTNEEQAVGLQQPAGIGQRPRPMSAETIMSGGNSHGYTDNYADDYNNRYNQQRRMQASPPKRPFQTFRNSRSNIEDNNLPPQSAARMPGSSSSTPCPSPSPQSASPARSTGGGSGISSCSSGSVDSNSDPGANSTAPCRYFVMKCNNQKNLEISQSKGIWATSAANERKINGAFQDGKTVYLIFSVQGSGHFQGYARMTSQIGREKSPEFSAPGLSGIFSSEWVKRANVPFMATHHLHNQWNENRKVQVSRDGQELEPSVGDALLRLWDRYPNYQKRSSPSSGGMKTILKHAQQGKQAAPQQQKQESASPGARQNKPIPKDSGVKQVQDMRKDSVEKIGADGDGAEVKGFGSGSSASSPISANSPCTVSSGSQESYNPDLDPTSHLHGHPDPSQGYPPRGFNFQPPVSSTAQIISHGVFPPNLQVAPGFNPMYHVGPMSAAVLPSQQAMSPRPGLSPVMILQRGSGGSPGQVHPHPGFISQGFGGQAPGAYQGQGSQGQK